MTVSLLEMVQKLYELLQACQSLTSFMMATSIPMMSSLKFTNILLKEITLQQLAAVLVEAFMAWSLDMHTVFWILQS